MRGSGKLFVAGLVLTLGAAAVDLAFAAVKEPVSGELLPFQSDRTPTSTIATPSGAPSSTMAEPGETPVPAAPAPTVAPAPALSAGAAESTKKDDTSWGLLVRGGYFGLPNSIVDLLFVKHPDVEGSSSGAEIRYHGNGGGRGIASIGLAIDSGAAKADGVWQEEESSKPTTANGEIDMLAITLTGYWSLFPSWYVHPYIGIGIGVAHVKGFYKNEIDRFDADIWIPALHVPVGLAIELGKHVQLTAEGRFINGIAIGGALQVRF